MIYSAHGRARWRAGLVVGLLLVAGTATQATEPFRFPEGKYGQGELKYVNGVPVLIVAGTPEAMGEQMGVLAVKPATRAMAIFKDVIHQHKLDLFVPILVRFGEGQLAKYPDAYRREFEAMVKASGAERDLLVIANTFNELRHLAGCSALMVDPDRSKTGSPLMGRNWDFLPVAGMHAYSLVIVYRPVGKRAFAIVSFPGAVAVGCVMSGMNSAGLALGGNTVKHSADQARQVDWSNTPNPVIARRILEECATIDEAAKLIRTCKPAERMAFVACDRCGGAVFEMTPKTVVVRREKGVCTGTNHFRSPELGVATKCARLAALAQASAMPKLGIDDVTVKMHEANHGVWTAHTMVFEPGPLKLHVAFGDGVQPATSFPLHELDLAALMDVDQ